MRHLHVSRKSLKREVTCNVRGEPDNNIVSSKVQYATMLCANVIYESKH